MSNVLLYFHVHQPVRLKRFSIFRADEESFAERYFDTEMNKHYFMKAARQCYLPANAILQKALENDKMKVSFSITGTFVEQAKEFCPEVLESFKRLFATGNAELVGETYYHSLASLYEDKSEFREQVLAHKKMAKEEFNQEPKVFRNTEVIYDNVIAGEAAALGFNGALAEGADHVLGWRSPNYAYASKNRELKLLLRNYRLSDDVGYRFSSKEWKEWPLTADRYAQWLSSGGGDTINLFMDYETFGEHHWSDTGIFQFLEHLPREATARGVEFKTASETLEGCEARDALDVPFALSWADMERDASAWLGNRLQQACFHELQGLKNLADIDPESKHAFGLLQTSDHLYYLCTKSWADGDVHKHFSPHKDWGPYENFINYMNVLKDFRRELQGNVEGHATNGKQAMNARNELNEGNAHGKKERIVSHH